MLFLFPEAITAQSYRLKAHEVSYKHQNEWGWSEWSEWNSCDIDISFNFDTNRIIIFSQETQDYSISQFLDKEIDNNGESNVMRCIDSNGLICRVRLRTQYNPKGLQLYIEYKDMAWVYNVTTY